MFETLFAPPSASSAAPAEQFLLALLLAFIVGQLNAWFYRWTYRGLSYQRSLTHAIILIAIVAALSMHLVAHSIIAVFGLLGGMAIIRFRTMLREPRDSAYVLLSLVCGMAAGFGFHVIAIVGAVFANLVAWYLQVTGFGGMYTLESLLRFQIRTTALDGSRVACALEPFCRSHVVISVDEVGSALPGEAGVAQCTYKLRLRDPHQGPALVAALKAAVPAEGVQLLVEPGDED